MRVSVRMCVLVDVNVRMCASVCMRACNFEAWPAMELSQLLVLRFLVVWEFSLGKNRKWYAIDVVMVVDQATNIHLFTRTR